MAYDSMELLKKALSGDAMARGEFININLGLVGSVVRRFFNASSVDYEDLFQIGSIGLIKAVDRFDLSFNVCFSTYAVPVIAGEIKRYLRDDGVIKVSRELKKTACDARRAQEEIERESGEGATISQLAQKIGKSEGDIIMALDAVKPPEYLYDDSNDKAALAERISIQSEYDMVEKIALKDMLSHLKAREREIIILRYFKNQTQSQTARMIGVSQVQVSRLEKKILQSLREKLIG